MGFIYQNKPTIMTTVCQQWFIADFLFQLYNKEEDVMFG